MQLSEQAKHARREYMRKWREKNKARVQAYNARYWEQVATRQPADRKRA